MSSPSATPRQPAQSPRALARADSSLQCAAHILKRHGLQADKHYDLSQMGVSKKYHEDFDPAQAAQLLQQIQQDLATGEPADGPAPKTCSTSTSAEDEPAEPSSPTCYLKEFKDW